MNAVIYYSNTGQSKKVAEVLAQQTKYRLLDLTRTSERNFGNVALVFPVHCQNIPAVAKEFLKTCHADNLAVIATYGKMCHGNVLHESQKLYRGNIVAAAYVPTKHAYLEDTEFADFDRLQVVADKFNVPTPVVIPRCHKNLFANFFPGARSRAGVKLYKTGDCDGCGICASVCTHNAITCGKPNRKCIRCLKCVVACPVNALKFSLRLPMLLYLGKKKADELIIYV